MSENNTTEADLVQKRQALLKIGQQAFSKLLADNAELSRTVNVDSNTTEEKLLMVLAATVMHAKEIEHRFALSEIFVTSMVKALGTITSDGSSEGDRAASGKAH